MAMIRRTFVPPAGISGGALLDAIQYVETGGGNWPRIEIAWMPEGARVTVQGRVLTGTGRQCTALAAKRYHRWGPAAAASWGPWQLLFHTAADLGYKGPPHGLHSRHVSLPYVVLRLDQIAEAGASTVEDFADAWNSGTHRDSIVPGRYIRKLVAAYERFRWSQLAGDAG